VLNGLGFTPERSCGLHPVRNNRKKNVVATDAAIEKNKSRFIEEKPFDKKPAESVMDAAGLVKLMYFRTQKPP